MLQPANTVHQHQGAESFFLFIYLFQGRASVRFYCWTRCPDNKLSVLLVFFALGAGSSTGERGGVTAGLQMVKQLVS